MYRVTLLLLVLFSCAHAQADEFDDLRLKWRDALVGQPYNPSDSHVQSKLAAIANKATGLLGSTAQVESLSFLGATKTSAVKSKDITTAYSNLYTLALAYATPDCSLKGSVGLRDAILAGLSWMHNNRYSKTTVRYDNWWDWEIGAPQKLNDICVLLYGDFSADLLKTYMDVVDFYTAVPERATDPRMTGTMTGANLVWKARVVGVRACLVKDAAKLAKCRDAFSAVLPYVASGDGFYTDGSFIQHGEHPYTAGYGAALLENIAPLVYWLEGSQWAVTDINKKNIYRWVFDSFEPILYKGAAWDLVRGRQSGRNSGPLPEGDKIMESILVVSQFAPEPERYRMQAMIKEWAQQVEELTRNNAPRKFLTSRDLDTYKMAKVLMADDSITPRGELVAHYTFAQMDRVIHLGAGYGFGIAMCSSRIANFESINGENLQGWFTGDGHTMLYNADLSAYSDAYNYTVDPYRLPGVTADVGHRKSPVESAKGERTQAQGQDTRSPHSLVGGATLDDFGSACMQFNGVGVTLTGYKSWFMFDDEIVCLGSGITSTDSRPIETTVEQRKLNALGNNAFMVNGDARATTLTLRENLQGVKFAHLAGNVPNSDIGYYFPKEPSLMVSRDARSGSNSDIYNTNEVTEATRNYLRMTLEHGANPLNATYQYVLLPGRSAERTRQYSSDPQVQVLANSTSIQAVSESTLGITAANFLTNISQSVGGITSNKIACVLVRKGSTFIDVSVSDPTQLNAGTIDLEIQLNGVNLVSKDTGVTVEQSSPFIRMSVDVASSYGKTFKARFYKLPPTTVTRSPVADTYVFDANSAQNHGVEPILTIKTGSSGFNREAFLRFDVPPPPGNALLIGASLQLSCVAAQIPGLHRLALVRDNNWQEDQLNWVQKPVAEAPFKSWTPVAGTSCVLDVSTALPPSGLVSFKIYSTTTTRDGYVTYGSKDNPSATLRPQLVLLYAHTPPQVSLVSPADGTTILSGGSITLNASVYSTDGAITDVTFYDGENIIGALQTPPYSLAAVLGGGTHMLKVVAQDAYGLSSSSIPVRIDVALTPIEQWRQQRFGTLQASGPVADTADPDEDGLVNLLEYACLTDPNLSTSPATLVTANGTNVDFTYTKNKAATDVTYSVEWTDSLQGGSWRTTGVTSVVVSDNGSAQQIRATVPLGAAKRVFVRLRVTR